MKEVIGNIWNYPADYICITTNGDVKANGAAVMGRGIARQALQRYPEIDKMLGRPLKTTGNFVYLLQVRRDKTIISFPVKQHWKEKADLKLIAVSTITLAGLAMAWKDKTFVLPRPGCGNGHLSWQKVKPIIQSLPDNVHIIDLP